jgi:transcription-repair coupling factor (superfamily II helicase)
MDRLVCGDVGFGKQVAIRAAFKAVDNSKSCDIGSYNNFSVPTLQNFYRRLKDMPVSVGYLNRFRTAKKSGNTKIISRR